MKKYFAFLILIQFFRVVSAGTQSDGKSALFSEDFEDGAATLSPTYCQCSVGYVGFMFQKFITGKPVQVELIESLRRGGKGCRFKVTI